ncbi:hypothetical protein ACHQM5_022087 [Ranunculus cassubicifolius]
MAQFPLRLIFTVTLLLISDLPSIEVDAKVSCFVDEVSCRNDFGCVANCLGCEGKCIKKRCQCVHVKDDRQVEATSKKCIQDVDCGESCKTSGKNKCENGS